MKHFKIYADVSTIHNWNDLGNAMHIFPRFMAYAHKFRDKLQHKIKLGKRTVYSSDSPLSLIQKRLSTLASFLLSQRPDNEVAIAYRNGLNVHDVLAQNTECALLIKTDIVKYYDNISYANIQKTLVECGLNPSGAKLVASYCCVWNGKFSSLQQGSSCSPAIANLVGNRCLDVPILKWLRANCPVEFNYYRYSDNIALFCKELPSSEFIKAYKAAVRDIARKHTFKTHSWSTIANNHPARHQEFLGVVLNKTANIYRVKRDWFRAVLFNAAVGDIVVQAGKFFKITGGLGKRITSDDDLLIERFEMAIQGYIAYVQSVNAKFALRASKLFEVIKYRMNNDVSVSLEALSEIKKYSDTEESLEHYRDRVLKLL